jgi:hypothetical protein
MEAKFCAKPATATILCAWAKKLARRFSVEAAMLFSKKSMERVSHYRSNRETSSLQTLSS